MEKQANPILSRYITVVGVDFGCNAVIPIKGDPKIIASIVH